FTSSNFFVTGSLSIVLYLIVILSYSLFKVNVKIAFLENIFVKKVSYSKIYNLALILLIITMLALLYSILSRGFTDWFFSNSRMHFHGSEEAETLSEDSWLIDKLFMFGQVSALLFWGLLQKQFDGEKITEGKKFKFLIPLFIISLSIAFMLLYRSSGRLMFFRFIAVFLISSVYISRKGLLKKGILISVLGAIVVLYGRTLFRIFLYTDHVVDTLSDQGTELRNAFFSFISNFSFPFFSASNNLNYVGVEYNLFMDLFKMPLTLIPPRLIDIDLSSSSGINTARTLGQPDSTVPSDILSYGLINGGYLGVLLVGISFGVILKLLNSYSRRLVGPVAVALFVYLALNIGFRVMYFDPLHFLRGTFSFIIAMVFYSLLIFRVRMR